MRRTTRSLWLFPLLIALLAAPLCGQGLPTAWPQEVGLSGQRLERIRAVLQAEIDRGELAGVSALVARRGKVAYFENMGFMDREAEKPMAPDTIFRIASMTKAITSTAVLILFEEGHFLLDDPVSRFIPELKELQVAVVDGDGEITLVPAEREVTIRHLLSHSSGFTYGFFNQGPVGKLYREAGLWTTPETTLADFVAKLGELPLVHQPGTAWEYGVSTDVLGRLVEVVSGQPFESFLAERLFAPLGMTDTAFYVPEEKRGRFAVHYVARDGALRPAPTSFRGYEMPPTLPSGGGGLVSTMADYARFLQMYLNGGALDGQRILGRKSIELMTADHIRGLPRSAFLRKAGFGLGFSVRGELGSSGRPGSPGSYSWGGIFNTFFWVDPTEELFALVMTQVSPFGHGNLLPRFQALVYQAIVD